MEAVEGERGFQCIFVSKVKLRYGRTL